MCEHATRLDSNDKIAAFDASIKEIIDFQTTEKC